MTFLSTHVSPRCGPLRRGDQRLDVVHERQEVIPRRALACRGARHDDGSRDTLTKRTSPLSHGRERAAGVGRLGEPRRPSLRLKVRGLGLLDRSPHVVRDHVRLVHLHLE